MNLKEKKNNLVWPSLFPLFQPKDFPQFETSVSTCIFAMFILNGFEHSPRLFEACHHCHLCCYIPKVWINYRKHEHIGYVLPHFTTLHCDSAPALSLLKHTTSSRNNTMVFYPTLTNFWIVLILKSSEDLALIRWLM